MDTSMDKRQCSLLYTGQSLVATQQTALYKFTCNRTYVQTSLLFYMPVHADRTRVREVDYDLQPNFSASPVSELTRGSP